MRWDDDGSERVFYPFVFVASLLVVSAFVFSQMAQSQIAGHWDLMYQTIGDKTYIMREPSDGYDVDADHIVSVWDHEADTNYEFYEDAPGEDDAFQVAVLMDNEEYGLITLWLQVGMGGDFGDPITMWDDVKPEHRYIDAIVIYVEWGWWDSETTAISFSSIVQHKVSRSNQSVVDFNIRNNNTYALVITTNGTSEGFYTDLYAGQFNIQIGVDVSDANEAESSMWVILGQILTAQTPDIGPTPNLIMISILYPAMGFIAFAIISRVVPFIAGA